jgi:ATP-dependent Clp protease adaptor protein ClpS
VAERQPALARTAAFLRAIRRHSCAESEIVPDFPAAYRKRRPICRFVSDLRQGYSNAPLSRGGCDAIFKAPMNRSVSLSAPVAPSLRAIRAEDVAPAVASMPTMADDNRDAGDGDMIGLATRTRARPKKPSMFKVLMLNDDYTPMEFVVMVLKRFFHMDLEQATRVMLHVHQRGVGVCGIFPYEIAETKVNQVMDFARQNQHPLQCTLEKA